jgi:hypothetical protein
MFAPTQFPAFQSTYKACTTLADQVPCLCIELNGTFRYQETLTLKEGVRGGNPHNRAEVNTSKIQMFCLFFLECGMGMCPACPGVLRSCSIIMGTFIFSDFLFSDFSVILPDFKSVNKKDENIKKNNNLNKQLLKKQKQKTI